MKILVAVKRVVDANVSIRVKPDGSGVDIANLKMSINPFDEIAVEEAVRLVEQGTASEVIAVSVGPDKAQEVLRTALAIGADRAILVRTDDDTEPLGVARAMKAIVEREGAQLVFTGKQAIDDDCNQTGQMLASMLDWGQGAFVSRLGIEGGVASVTREVDGGLETIAVRLPAVLTVDLRLNQPRYATLPAIMKAKKKPLDIVTPADLGVDLGRRLKTLKVVEPPRRAAGTRVASVGDLVERLKTEAKVI